jgi:Xaa-Pro aminopeptidase
MPPAVRAAFGRVRAVLLPVLLLVPSLVAQEPIDKAEFAARRARLLERIPDGLAIVLAATEHPYPTRFRQSPDFYYLTGLEEPGAVLVLNGVTKNATVFALKRPAFGFPSYPPQLRDVPDAQERYGIAVQPMEGFFSTLSFIGANPGLKQLYLQLTPPDGQLQARSEAGYFAAQALEHPLYGQPQPWGVAIERLRAALPRLAPADVSPHLDELRWIKTAYEIERLRRSGKIAAAAVAEAMRSTKPGMYEYEIAAAAQYVNTRLGADGDGFPPIVPSGPLTPIVHYRENRRQLQAGEVVYMDYGSDVEYYTSDITRTWPVSGKFSAEQEKMYRCVLEARNAIIAAMKPGVTLDGLQDVAEAVYTKHGYRDAFMAWGRYIGHFIGISVHDVGATGGAALTRPLPAGVVFNVEPIIQFEDKKIHMRLEDTVLLTERGAENLTAGVPAEVDQVYGLVKERGMNAASVAGR